MASRERERQDRRCKKGGGQRPEPGPRRVGRYYYIKNINQQVTTGSSERREQEMHEGESTQKLEMVERTLRKLLLGSHTVFSGK